MILCMSYLRYIQEKSNPTFDFSKASIFSRFFVFIKSNGTARYPLYLVGMALNMTILFGLRGYIADNSSWSNWLQAFYGSFAYTGFALGLSCLIMPALLGRAEFVRFLLGGEIWLMFSSIAHGISLYMPVYALAYFLGMSTAQHLDYQFMFYNFCGILIFTLIFAIIYMLLVERPFTSMINLRHDILMVNSMLNLQPESPLNIDHYKLGDD